MGSNSSLHNKQCPSSSDTSFATVNTPYVTNDIHQDQNPSPFVNPNATFLTPAVGRQAIYPALVPLTDGFGQSRVSTIPPGSNQSYDATQERQAPPNHNWPFMTPSESAQKPVWNGPYGPSNFNSDLPTFDHNAYPAFLPHAVNSHVPCSPDGHTNASHADFNSGLYNSTPGHTRPATILNPKETAMLSSKRFVCQDCGTSFKRKADVKRHSGVHRTSSLLCKRCGKGFYRKDKLDEHMRTHK